jgi:hypothetical protein
MYCQCNTYNLPEDDHMSIYNRMICYIVLIINCFVFFNLEAEITINPHGYWEGEDAINEHKTDYDLGIAIANFFLAEGAETVVDFGCGIGEYVKLMMNSDLSCDGFDGNPDTEELSGGVASVIDLSEPFDLQKQYDWVMSLEVAEHLPKEYEKTFIENLDRHNKCGILLSWARKGQGGYGHFNEQDNDYVKDLMASYGYENDLVAENVLRSNASLWWFKNTVMVFRRPEAKDD